MEAHIEGYEPVDSNFTASLPEIVSYHRVNSIIGAVCTILNIPLLLIFLTSPKLRHKHRNRILITLCVADTFNTLSIYFMGQNRVDLYSSVITFRQIPIRTSWDCALEPWLFLRTIGDIWPPTIQMVIGIERAAAVFVPVWFHKNGRNR
ncbi:unnamed protein product [Caenorhabditis auriculariae]|uniref:G-protein coupled receptors family 1 profile domain-containing protein n=1 Tax=Caenorhabditis auriculariae TaxID=2777116 RepID=A0A8S1H7Y4_9PELO|nr:unnamed protein product [Caenorhabditis auriculariae]